MIRERFEGGAIYGCDPIDILIDRVIAPLVMDSFLGPAEGCECIKDAAHAVGEDIENLLSTP
jgi:hypothetical protein